jgi:hypothetical protein
LGRESSGRRETDDCLEDVLSLVVGAGLGGLLGLAGGSSALAALFGRHWGSGIRRRGGIECVERICPGKFVVVRSAELQSRDRAR